MVNAQIAALPPSELLQALLQRRHPCLRFGISFGNHRQYADAPHPLALLRARRKRPCSRSTKERNEFTTFHRPMPPYLN